MMSEGKLSFALSEGYGLSSKLSWASKLGFGGSEAPGQLSRLSMACFYDKRCQGLISLFFL